MIVKYKPTFVKKYKKLTSQQTEAVNKAVDLVVSSPEIGVQKKGDLSHIWVYKFKFNKQLNSFYFLINNKNRTNY